MSRFRSWLLFVFAIGCWAQQPGNPIAKARLEGSVVSSAGGPVPRAQVQLQGPPGVSLSGPPQPRNYSVVADDAGRFKFENVEPSRNYQLTATRPGYLQGRYGARSPTGPGVPFALESGQSTTGVVVTMIPQGVVSGRIVDVNGDPIPGATVTMLRRSYVRGFRQLTPVGANNANDLGDYRIANLAPGRYYMAVTDRRPKPEEAAGVNSTITTYFPNGTDAQSAAPIDLGAGQEMRGVEVQMRMGRVFSVHGKAVDASGAGIGNVALLLAPQVDIAASTILNPLTRVQVQTASDGSFAVDGVGPGLYTLQTAPVQAGASRGLGRTEITVNDANIEGAQLVIGPGQSVTGTVELDGGEIKDLFPANAGGQAPGRLSIVLSDISPLPLNPTALGSVKEDGTFIVENVARGKFQLSVAPLPLNTYLKSAKFSNVDIVHSAIDLTSGGGAGIDVMLARNPADVSGTILSLQNELTAAMTVTLWSADPEPGVPDDGVRVGLTDETGGFRFMGLRPGTYYLAAWEDVDLGLVQYRDFLALLEGQATKLEVGEGEHKAAQIRIISAEQSQEAEGRLP